MELTRKNIHTNRLKCKSGLQMNLNDDINVPDSKPDLASIMKVSGELTFEDQKILSGKLYLKGYLLYQVLYLSAEEDHQIHNITGRLPFDEALHLNEDCSIESTIIRWEFEDLSANMINSRKISLKSLVQISVTAEEVFDESVCVAARSDAQVCTRTDTLHLTSLAACKKDSYRFRDEITLPSSKSNIRELLYRSLSLKNVDIRLLADQFSIKGEICVFFLYSSEDGDAATEYYETDLPFHAVIDCNGASESMTPDITISIADKTLEVRRDADGETRVISLDVLMELQIKIYEDSTIDVIRDLYSPSLKLIPEFHPITYENLLLHNTSRVRVSDHAQIDATAPKILQVCHGSGTTHIDDIAPTDDGLMVEGYIDADIFYITPEDTRPMYAFKTAVPFQQLIEARDITPNSVYSVTPELEQLTVLSSDSDELEIKASVLLNTLVFDRVSENFLDSVKEEPLDYHELLQLPGITGYVVRENDDLWSIAKQHYTTVESIMELNELTDSSPAVGTHLLLLKEIAP